ncbi:Ig-like domain-containing protein, partial [Christiangramia sp. SM2212]
ITVSTEDTFTVTVTGDNGCTDTASVSTTLDNEAPVAGITNDNGLALDCNTPSTTLTASGGSSYAWTNTNGDNLGDSASITVSTEDTFTVTVTGDNGCTDTASVSTTLDNEAPVAGITNDNGLALDCNSPSTTLTASGGSSYAWTNTAGDNLGDSASITVSTEDTFTVTVTGDNGCTDTASVSTTLDNEAPVAGITNDNGLALDCNTPSTTLTASGGSSYAWTNTNGDNLGDSASITVSTEDTFTVTVTGDNGCTDTASVSTTLDNEAPVAGITNDNGLALDCNTPSTTLTASGGSSYAWTNTNGDNLGDSASITVSTEDTFTVTVTGDNGCTDTAFVSTTLDTDEETPSIVLDQQTDCDIATGSISVESPKENTTYTISSTNNYSESNESGIFTGLEAGTYTVTATNNDSGCSSAPSNGITIEPQPMPAVANNDSVDTNEDEALTIDALSNDTNPEDGDLIIESYTQTSNGTVTQNEDDTFEYTPNENYNGTDSFTYIITNGNCDSSTATVTITVNPVNDAPVANDDNAVTDEDTAVVINVLENDTDIDGDELTVVSVTQPSNGNAVINEDGTVTYTPNENFNGDDEFTYTIEDEEGLSDTATVFVTVNPVNDAPVANDDSAVTDEDTAVVIEVLENDVDVDGDELTVVSVTDPENGSVVINEDGTVTYTPNTDFEGEDEFTYTIEDEEGLSDTATVTVIVAPTNDAPVANDDNAVTDEDTAVVIYVLENDTDADGDELTVVSVTQPSNGTVVINEDGTVTYTPNENFNGNDEFTYTIEDEEGLSDTATVFVTVNPVNDAPVANDDSAVTDEDTAVVIEVLENDTDVDGDELTVVSVTDPENGSVVINEDGTVTYTPNTDFEGEDEFTYTIEDEEGLSDTATVTVIVAPTNDAPVANDDNAVTDEDTAVVIDVLENDTDVDGDELTVVSVTQPSNGTVVINEDGTVTYTPNDNFNGDDEFTYTIEDEEGLSDTATVFVTVNPVNDAPVANDDSAETDQDVPVEIAVLDNDTDLDGDELTVVSVTDPENGSVVINEDGTVTYTPNDSFTGEDVFEYTISDGNGGTDTAVVTITVNDTEGPEIACPANMNLNNDPGVCGAIVDFTIPEFTDNSGSATIEQTAGPAPGDLFPVGTTTVTFVATDASGNSTTCSFDVIVTDNEAPVVETIADINVDTDTDVCGAVVEFGNIITSDNCEVDTVEVTEGLISGSVYPVGTTEVTINVTDIYGNTTTTTFSVTVNDNEMPVVSCPSDIITTTEAGEAFAIVNFDNATATDNCDVSVEQTAGPVSGSEFPIGDTVVTFTAIDASGNSTECSFTVTVEDDEDPSLECPSDFDSGVDTGVCGAVVEFETPTGFDNSGEVTVTQTNGPASGAEFPVGTTTVEFTATDAAGNSATCSFTVTINDDEAPVIEDMENITVNNDAGICGAVVSFETPGGTDNCGIESVIMTEGLDSGSEFPVGETTITYVATDTAGLTATTSFTVTVIDNEAPSIECPEDITVNVAFGTTSAIVEYETVTVTDNCGGSTTTMTSGIASGEEFPVGDTVITYTVTDANGNESTCQFTVTVEENPAPAPPPAPTVDVTQATCSNPTGTITVEAEQGLSYSIDGENFQTEGVFTDLAPGTYDVVSQNGLGQLSDLTTVIIEEPVAEEIELVNNGTVDLCVDDSAYDLTDLFVGDFDESGVWIDTNNTGALENGFVDPDLLALGSYTFEYRIEGNCPSSTIVTVLVNDDCVVLDCTIEDVRDSISKAVTPNGDNKNDFFTVDLDIACGFTYNVKIFNRWGAKIFDAQNYQNNWDGYSDSSFGSSNQLPSGTYFYVLEINEGNFEPIQGYIYLGTK